MTKITFLTSLILFASCGQNSDLKISSSEAPNENKSNEQTNKNVQQEGPEESSIEAENIAIETALTFINSYIENCNNMKESMGVVEWVNSNKLATKSLKTEVKKLMEEAYKDDPEMGLGFDPLFDAQDYPEEGFELVEYDNQTNFMIAKGKNWKDFKLTIKLVKNDNKWLVDGCGIINIPGDKRSKR